MSGGIKFFKDLQQDCKILWIRSCYAFFCVIEQAKCNTVSMQGKTTDQGLLFFILCKVIIPFKGRKKDRTAPILRVIADDGVLGGQMNANLVHAPCQRATFRQGKMTENFKGIKYRLRLFSFSFTDLHVPLPQILDG